MWSNHGSGASTRRTLSDSEVIVDSSESITRTGQPPAEPTYPGQESGWASNRYLVVASNGLDTAGIPRGGWQGLGSLVPACQRFRLAHRALRRQVGRAVGA